MLSLWLGALKGLGSIASLAKKWLGMQRDSELRNEGARKERMKANEKSMESLRRAANTRVSKRVRKFDRNQDD